MFNDEDVRRRERKLTQAQQQQLEFLSLKQRMAVNQDLQQDMKRQSQLTAEMQRAYKRGDKATLKRLERILAPDEDNKVAVKHPWK